MSDLKSGSEYDAWSVALKIHELAEIGSQEFKSSSFLEDVLRSHGFQVEEKFNKIPTAFKAVKKIGSGTPVIAFLAEYDALPGIGHACGHNLIAASAVFSAIRSTEIIKNGTIMVLGTPDEEGSGDFAGSKILMANDGVFKNIDLVLGSHPGPDWNVGRHALAVQDFEVTFHGVAAHEAASPEKGKSALNGAVLTYTAVNMLRQHVKRDANVVMHAIIKEGGTASNVTPEKTILLMGIRSSDLSYHAELTKKFLDIVDGCAKATETTYDVKRIGPLFTTDKSNPALSNAVRDVLVSKGVDVPPLEKTLADYSSGSTDFANVSQVAPSLEVGFQIAEENTPWHSRQSLEAAKSSWGKKSLLAVIDGLSETAKRYTEDESLRKRINEDFKKAE